MFLALLYFASMPPAEAAEKPDTNAAQEELKSLKQRIADLEKLIKQQSGNSVAEEVPVGEKATEENKSIAATGFTGEAPEEEKGSVEISTAGSTMTVGGQIRLDAAYNNPGGPSDYGMGTSAIPSPAAAQGERGLFSMQARSSRFWFRTDTPVGSDALRTLIEIDFWGSAGNERVSNSHNIRLRHAYAEYAGFTVGQTYSTFMHSGNTPNVISDAAGDMYVRQPLIRYTRPFDKGDVQIALEQPETTLTDINGNQVAPNDDRFPDLTAKLTWHPDWGQLMFSGLLRQLRIDTGATAIGGVPAGVVDRAVGGALFVSARIDMMGGDDLRLGFAMGNALGRYAAYNSFNDAAIDAMGNIHLQRAMLGFAAYQHWWNDNWHSSIAYFRTQVKNDLAILPTSVYRSVQSYHANLRWAPLTNTSMGIEYIHATSMKENGEKGTLQRVHFSGVYKF